MAYWVVNQGKTYQDEVEGGYLWAPITNKAGRNLVIYTNLTKVKRGDIIFSMVKGKVVAVGICEHEHTQCKNPLTKHKEDWIDDGWMIRMRFVELESKLVVKDHMDRIRPLLPDRYKFVLPNGNSPQQGYLFSITEQMAKVLGELIGRQYTTIIANEDAIEGEIRGRTDIPTTEIQRLVKSRCGQGQYRLNVLENEKACRITGVDDPRFLIASHIKPWAKCSDAEKLDGCNGLMLTPNTDKLFDRGFLSFGDDGTILVSSETDAKLLSALGVDRTKNVGGFSPRQCEYLKYHREFILRG